MQIQKQLPKTKNYDETKGDSNQNIEIEIQGGIEKWKRLQDEDDSQTTFNKITQKVRENFESIFIDSLSRSNLQVINIGGIQNLESWYKKARKEDNILETILEDIINETEIFARTIWYCQCREHQNKLKKKTGRIVFEINSSGIIKDPEIFSDKERVCICGEQVSNLTFIHN